MRTTRVKILDTDYPLCYSTRVVIAVYQQYGGLDEMHGTLSNLQEANKAFEGRLWMLHQLMQAGQRYAALLGSDSPAVPSLSALRVSVPSGRYGEIMETIENTIAAGSMMSIKSGEPKNKKAKVKTTPGKKSPEWFLWHGLHIGLDYNTTLDLPHGELLTLISAQNIYNGAPDESNAKNSDFDAIPDWD